MGKVQNFSLMKSTHFVLQLMAITTRVFRIGALGGGHALQIARDLSSFPTYQDLVRVRC